MTRRKAKAEVFAVLADGGWWSSADVQAATGLSQSTVVPHLNDLARYPWGHARAETRQRATATVTYDDLAEQLGHPVGPYTLKPGQILHLPHRCRVARLNPRSVTIDWAQEDAPDVPARPGVIEYRLRKDHP